MNLDLIPKPSSKGEKIRYEGFSALESILKSNNFSVEYISNLKEIHNKIQTTFGDLIQINYTPNFITFACNFPKGRSKTFLFVRFKRNCIHFDFMGQTLQLIRHEELSGEVVSKLKLAFNNLSNREIN